MFPAFFVAVTALPIVLDDECMYIMTIGQCRFSTTFFVFRATSVHPIWVLAGSCTWGSVLARSDSRIATFSSTRSVYIDRGKIHKLFRFVPEDFGLIREILNVSVGSMILYFLHHRATWFSLFRKPSNTSRELPCGHFNIIPQVPLPLLFIAGPMLWSELPVPSCAIAMGSPP